MKALLIALELERKYNQMDLEESVKEFEISTGQKVPDKAVEEFKVTGLNNVDFFTSDFLNRYGLKNLLQVMPLRSEEECLEKAKELALSYEPEKLLPASHGEMLPPEYIFDEEGVQEFIRFCKGM